MTAPRHPPKRGALWPSGVAAGTLLGTYLYAQHHARRAERAHPPIGHFLDVEGVRLHCIDCGWGQPIVLLHGNAGLIQDYALSLLPLLAGRYRVIAFDRPGYGYSTRPRDRTWTPQRQAVLFHAALRRLEADAPVIVGHSWGATVALAYALQFPQETRSAVLLSGFYFPVPRPILPLLTLPGQPVVGPILSHTLAVPLFQALMPLIVRRIFAPNPVPGRFRAFPFDLATRPGHIHTSLEEDRILRDSVAEMMPAYDGLKVPLAILCGEADRIVAARQHSLPLSQRVPFSRLRILPSTGHMIHHIHPCAVLAAIEWAATIRSAWMGRSTGNDEYQVDGGKTQASG